MIEGILITIVMLGIAVTYFNITIKVNALAFRQQSNKLNQIEKEVREAKTLRELQFVSDKLDNFDIHKGNDFLFHTHIYLRGIVEGKYELLNK